MFCLSSKTSFIQLTNVKVEQLVILKRGGLQIYCVVDMAEGICWLEKVIQGQEYRYIELLSLLRWHLCPIGHLDTIEVFGGALRSLEEAISALRQPQLFYTTQACTIASHSRSYIQMIQNMIQYNVLAYIFILILQ